MLRLCLSHRFFHPTDRPVWYQRGSEKMKAKDAWKEMRKGGIKEQDEDCFLWLGKSSLKGCQCSDVNMHDRGRLNQRGLLWWREGKKLRYVANWRLDLIIVSREVHNCQCHTLKSSFCFSWSSIYTKCNSCCYSQLSKITCGKNQPSLPTNHMISLAIILCYSLLEWCWGLFFPFFKQGSLSEAFSGTLNGTMAQSV